MISAIALAANLVLFGRLLRRLGLAAAPEDSRAFLRALELVGFSSKTDVRAAARTIYLNRREERELFDRAFELFWRRRGGAEGAPVLPRIRQDDQPPPTFHAERPREPEPPETDLLVDAVPSLASERERIRHVDFAALTRAEARDALGLLSLLRPAVPRRPSRRWWVTRRHGTRPANARMLRRSLSTAGEPMVWRWLAHPTRPRPIVLLCDISGSMERYSRLLLRFAHALMQSGGGARVEVFVFGTRLTRITRDLRIRDADAALQRVGHGVADWSGGTRIGESLRELNRRWVRRTIRSSAVVLLCSDGWERGDPALLQREMATLRRSCYRLLWLDPLAAQPGFEPAVAGLRAALPHVDALLPCASVASLEELGRRLELGFRVQSAGCYSDIRPAAAL